MKPIGIVAGSGIELTPLLDTIEQSQPFTKIEGLSASTVSGHAGRFVHGRVRGLPVVLQCGRLHIYEGCEPASVARTVDVLHRLGVGSVIFTNAAGGISPEAVPGTLMAVREILPWRCARWNRSQEPIPLDFTLHGADFSGVYAWVHGPSYETRAELRALAFLEADAVGMSTAIEVVRCRELGMRAAAVSCITNHWSVTQKLTHEHVLATAAAVSEAVRNCIADGLQAIAGR